MLQRMAAAAWSLRHRAAVIAGWALAIILATWVAARLPSVLQGGADAIPGTESDHVTKVVGRAFGKGTLYQFLVVIHHDSLTTGDPEFVDAVERVTRAAEALPTVRSVETSWNTERAELLGDDGHSALAIVTPQVRSFYQAEKSTAELRRAIHAPPLPAGMRVEVTGSTAMLHDLDEHSSSDLLAAERVALPLTLVILLVVFGAPLAALLPVLLALTATTIGLAGLYALSGWLPVSVFAENVTSMIGLGVGVDYALFILSRFREASRRGAGPHDAAAEALSAAGHSVVFSGATVMVGFLALFLVRAPFLHAIALGGVLVVATAVAASMTLLPALLATFGDAVNWPRRRIGVGEKGLVRPEFWERWAATVMKRPWRFLALSVAVLLVFVLPALRLKAWNIGPRHLPAESEARLGFEALTDRFPQGWMGPIVLLVEAHGDSSLLSSTSRRAMLQIATELRTDARTGALLGLPQVLARTGVLGPSLASIDELPEAARSPARRVLTEDGRATIMALVTPHEAGDPQTIAYLKELRARHWPAAEAAALTLRWGGSSAIMADFDGELFGSLPRVVLGVVLMTFVVLMVLFRSLLIPLKATLLNVVSVLSAYGFLVLVFQDGWGARWIGLTPPGGLNSFIVLMLFTILFGLSMDYEVFLLSRMREEYRASGDNDRAVAVGLARTGGIITSAALIMISIFAAFGFTRLVPTREFGLGLAFAVALDATLIRVVLVPALMKLSGRWNWWFPGRRAARPSG
jgi:RND superfamily putative drug exporter